MKTRIDPLVYAFDVECRTNAFDVESRVFPRVEYFVSSASIVFLMIGQWIHVFSHDGLSRVSVYDDMGEPCITPFKGWMTPSDW